MSTEAETTPETATADPVSQYCSSGCYDIATTLEAEESTAADAHHSSADGDPHVPVQPVIDADPDTNATADDDLEQAFFRVDGMHSAMCETFLETVAMNRPGVVDAEASYVTEAVTVTYDPDRDSRHDLEAALSRVGYTAYLRDDATGAAEDNSHVKAARDDNDARASETGGTRRAREMSGVRKRRSDDMLEVRYIAGVVFGTFLLVPYVAVLYPVYLAEFSEWWLLSLYGDAFASFDGVLMLPMFVILTGIVLYLAGWPLLRGAYISLVLRQPNTQLLAALTILSAYAYGTLAFVQDRIDIYYDLTIIVAALVMAAIFAEAMAKRQAIDRLTELTISQVDSARRLRDGDTESVPTSDLEAGDRVLVRAGERIPVDGTLESACTVDEAVVTGESLPVSKSAGEAVVGGSAVTDGAAIVTVAEETTSSIDRLTAAVWDLQSATHGVTRRADTLAGRLAPVVLASAAVVAIGQYVLGASPPQIILAALLTIICTSPWALGFATPAAVAANSWDAMAHGLVVFDETIFERLRAVDTVVFDKTGTLTTGEMTVLEANASPALLRDVAALEQRASHPAAAAIVDAFGNDSATASAGTARTDGGLEQPVREFDRHGIGVSGVVGDEHLLVGHPDLFRERQWELSDRITDHVQRARDAGRLPVVVGKNETAAGVIVVGDEPRDEWETTLERLTAQNINVVVLTGDERAATACFGDHPGVTHVFAGISPAGKTAAVRQLKSSGTVAMVGDGTNDAPALAEADIGLSLGSATALATDAAAVVLLKDDLTGVERAFRLARAARVRTRQNLGLALVYNAIVILIAAVGLLNPLFVTAAVLVCAGAIAVNAWRPLLSTESPERN
nr:cation-translocating P-type ATPase [Natronolimnobius sp. AArcel1]